MNLPMNAPLPTAQPQVGGVDKTAADYPQKFEDIAPGSKVLVGGSGVQSPFEAIVLDTMREHGPTAIPALHIVDPESKQEAIITASGLYTVTVLMDARNLAALTATPASALDVRTRPRTGVAVQFKGGLESATEIVSWAIGSAMFRYDGGNDQVGEHLQRRGADDTIVWPGDWVLKQDDGSFVVVRDTVFGAEYEEA